ncbi:hypothetical protein BDF19DRAFT_447132 [Syncephalis fuscata]|nr:hypothetical protein BDF19DRAFT_447132 [Syncephalis fuscata]
MFQSNFPNGNPNYLPSTQQGSQQQQVMNQLVMRPVPGTGPPAGSGPAYGLPTTEPLKFLRPLDQKKFEQLFAGGSLDGLRIAGDAVRDILQRSKLSNSALARIWQVESSSVTSRYTQAGSLTFPEFAVAMYLTNLAVQAAIRDEVSRIMNGPGGLVRVTDPGKGMNPNGTPLSGPVQMSNMQVGPSGPSNYSSYAPSSASNSSYSTQIQPYQALPPPSSSGSVSSGFMPSMSNNTANVPWAVTPEEKAAYDQVFTAWDTRGIGFISGETARAIFGQSGLSASALAQVWQLSDIHNHGKLNANEFAVAMHLIHRALAGQPVPYRLSPDLIPPSTRDLTDSVSSLKNSLVQDIVQQRHMSAAYGGKFSQGNSLDGSVSSNRSRYGKERDVEDWDNVYRPPRMGDVRKLNDDDLFGEIESPGYRSANRRKPAQRRKDDDPWANLRSTAERYGTSSLSDSGSSTSIADRSGSGRASQETIAELRKQLGEQRILLEALSYSAGDADSQYVTDDERKARDDMREVAVKVPIAEGAPQLEDKEPDRTAVNVSVETMDLSKFTPAAMSSSALLLDAAIAASRASLTPKPSPPKPSPPVSASSIPTTPSTPAKSDPDAIKNKAAELLAQRMAALTGKSIPVQSTKPAEPEKPVETTPEPPKETAPTMSNLLASATTKEERQKIIQEQAERRMKEREKFLRDTMGDRFPVSPTASQGSTASNATNAMSKPADTTSESAVKPAETIPPAPSTSAGSNNPFRAMAAATAATPEDEEAAARKREEEQAEAERQRAAARETMLSNAKAARERAQQAEKDALKEVTNQPRSPFSSSTINTLKSTAAPAPEVIKGAEAGYSTIDSDRDAVAEAARNARAQISNTFNPAGSGSTRSSTGDWDVVDKSDISASTSSVDVKKADLDAAVASASSALFGQSQATPAPSYNHGNNVVWAGSFEAQAMYEYVGQNPDDLSMTAGDIILVQPCADSESDWWFARKLKGADAGREGWFPISYVQRLDQGTATTAPAAPPTAPTSTSIGQVLYEFTAHDAGELNPDWWRVRYNGGEGLVPAAYVQLQ